MCTNLRQNSALKSLVDVLGVLVGILNALVSELGVADDGTSVCSQFNRRSSLENILELEVAGMD